MKLLSAVIDVWLYLSWEALMLAVRSALHLGEWLASEKVAIEFN